MAESAATETQRFPLSRQLLYGLGGPGYLLTNTVVVSIGLYFYLPPEGRGLDTQVSTQIFLGALTVFGIASLVGRIFDCVADPVVGFFSDRNRSRLGRRRSFMLAGILPMVLLPLLLFNPPGEPGSAVNGLFLAAVLSLYFIAFTVYVAPYLSLFPELAHTPSERARFSSRLALVSLPASTLIAMTWPIGLELFQNRGLSAEDSVRAVVLCLLVFSFLLCSLPILAVDEARYTSTTRSVLPFRVALRETLANRPFRVYLVGEMFFLLALAIKGPIVIYLVTVVLGRSEGFAGRLGLIVAGAGIISVPLIAWAARRLGVRRTLVASILITVPFLGALAFLSPASPGDPGDARNLSLMTVSLAALGLGIGSIAVLPRLLLAQIIDLDRQETGASRAALYYGVQGFLVKWVLGLGAAIVAFLFSRFGNSATEPLGVLLIGPAAAAISLLAALGFLRYPEGKVLEALAGDPTEPG